MKILHTVDLYAPSIGGSQEVVRQISEHLVSLGHDVTVATGFIPGRNSKKISGVKIKEFNITGNLVVGLKGEIDNYQKFVLNGKFDVVLNYAAQSWSTDALVEILPTISAKKLFVPCGFSGLKHPAFAEYYRSILKWIKEYDAIVFTSKYYQDYEYVSKYLKKNMQIIPNGAGELEFENLNKNNDYLREKLNIPFQDKVILTVSSHVHSKGHKESIAIFRASKIQNATLLIVGNSFADSECTDSCNLSASKYNHSIFRRFDSKQVIVRDLTRIDTVNAFSMADIFLFPSKIECAPLVIYECLAAGLPFISSSSGNVKEIVKNTNAGIVMRDIHDGAKQLASLLLDHDRLAQMSNCGRKYWNKYSRWDLITQKYEKLYKKLTKV
jgi:glycosyltransferase involved in cell wall biosynthesis